MKKLKKKRKKIIIKKDEKLLLPLYHGIRYKREKNKNNYNKSICYFLIFLIILFNIIIIIYFQIIKKKYFINNKEGKEGEEVKLKLSSITNTTILLIGIAKLENNYLREWVEYYKKIGITKIILCDNNPTDGENLNETIKDYVDLNFVEIDKDYRGKPYLQLDCYKKHFQINHMKYDWITINDIDEFIFLENGSGYINIQQFLDEPIFNDTDNIILTWKYYDDNDILDVVDGNYNVLKRFTHHDSSKYKGDANCLSKAIYKGKVERDYILGGHCIQGFEDKSGRKYVFRTADGKIMKFEGIGWCFYNFNRTHFPVSIHHFQLKSIGEYVKNKMLKNENIDPDKYNFKFFFGLNKLTEEKVKYALKLLDKDKLKKSQYNIDDFINKSIET